MEKEYMPFPTQELHILTFHEHDQMLPALP